MSTVTATPDITLFFLQASRSIRVAWLLEELNLTYTLRFFNRNSSMKAPPEYKEECGHPLGKTPILKDGDRTIYESGAIVEYLCEKYDTEGKLLPREGDNRVEVLEWIHAAEGTFMLHGLAIAYLRWNMSESLKGTSTQVEMVHGMGSMSRRI